MNKQHFYAFGEKYEGHWMLSGINGRMLFFSTKEIAKKYYKRMKFHPSVKIVEVVVEVNELEDN